VASLDFKGVAAAALAQAPTLLSQWLGGRAHGREWKGERRANGGPGDSWSVNLDTGRWIHGASGRDGGDLIDLYSKFFNVELGTAQRVVADLVNFNPSSPVRVLPSRATPADDGLAEPIPPDAPPLRDPAEGERLTTYKYDTFWVARIDRADGSKTFRQFTWRGGIWVGKGYPAPRPMYNRAAVFRHKTAPVIVVEGEKAADALAHAVRSCVIVTWASGAGAILQTDWEPLQGRDVTLWPDNDAPGREAMAKLAAKITPTPRIINPDGQPDGWDAADAVADGWDGPKILQWVNAHGRDPAARKTAVKAPRAAQGADPPKAPDTSPAADAANLPSPPAIPATDSPDTPAAVPAAALESPQSGEIMPRGSAVMAWDAALLDKGENGLPYVTLANISTIIQHYPAFAGKIWLDTFKGQIYHTLHGDTELWTDADARQVCVTIQQQLRLNKVTLSDVCQAVEHAAEVNGRDSLRVWLDSLSWDGTSRLDNWLCDCLGMDRTPYTMAVSRNWPIAMVARAYSPGCKVDNMPVLEGTSGISKTTFLEVLGGEWYKALPQSFGEKDFLQGLQGAWLVEIPDMTSFSRKEHGHIIAIITIRTDSFRAPYGRYVENHKRTAVFAATSETDDYLSDIRGRRRYWPLRCTEIDIDSVHGQRQQVFAEAIVRYKAGELWYEMPAEADTEQRARVVPDLWTDRVMDYCDARWHDFQRTKSPMTFTSSDILRDAIEMPLSKQTDVERRRIGRIMRENGWIIHRGSLGRFWKKVERVS
jgi:predicted P-loop ATPase